MRFANPAGLLVLAAAIPIVLLHILRPRRPRVEVSSTLLWQAEQRTVSAAAPWQRLRPSALLFLQLLAVLLLAVAAARPVQRVPAPLSPHTVFVLDASASMAAVDENPDRLDEAKRQAKALRRRLASGGLASVVVAAPEPRVVLSASPDRRAFDDAVGSVRGSAGAADFATAFRLAASLETPGVPIGFVLLSDGGLDPGAQRALLPGTRHVVIGERATNRGISHLSVEPRAAGLEALVAVTNFGGPAVTQRVRLDVDGHTHATVRVRLARGETVERSVELPQGERVEAFLEGDDLLPADDHAFAVAARRPPVEILVVGPENPFLDHVLAALPGVTVQRTTTPRAAPGVDLVVYDRVVPPADPGTAALYIAPPTGIDGVRVVGTQESPAVTFVRSDDPLLRELDLSVVTIGSAQRLDVPADDVLVAAESGPLLLQGERAGHPFTYMAFALEDSDLPLQVSFPLLVDRLVSELTAQTAIPALEVGDSLPVPPAATVRLPGGAREPAPPAGGLVTTEAGFHTISEQGRPDRLVAVNPPSSESDLAPVDDLAIPEPRAGERVPTEGERSFVALFLIALVVVLAVELYLSRRQSGVPRRQWRAAMVVRAAIVLAIIVAATGLSFPRRGSGVAVMFLIDASDSMGRGGEAAAVQWVREALRDQPDGARAGVAMFGGDARLELTVQERASLLQPSTSVDGSRTDLAGALRLAAAVLPADTRRRVVVLSDGRLTDGDARAEARRLQAEGIRVDVHTIDRAAAPDVALDRLVAPGRVSTGEQIPLRAVVTSTGQMMARVSLRHEEAVVEERTVELSPGENVVEFLRRAGSGGVERFSVAVAAGGDVVPENNRAFAAVEVSGVDRVLVAEGAPGEATALASALRAGGLTVDVVAAHELPAVDVLAGYRGVVIVDAEVYAFSQGQLEALTAAVRQLGRGLLVVGGERAYALGGYRDSALEALLPVISDITDPKRRPSVAEILALDTSGSMGACHCAEGTNGLATGGNRDSGGVNKTDISRAGAARAIAALSQRDQVGVLAFNDAQRMVIPLQRVPAEKDVREALGKLQPNGGTDLNAALGAALKELEGAEAAVKHVILFTDGFTAPGNLSALEAEAAGAREKGVTISVVATGEGAMAELARVAEVGGGRFYPGRNLTEIPDILVQEAIAASRSFINEGRFVPKVVGAGAPTQDLVEAPPLLGYTATTARRAASTYLRIGPEEDPLLSSWTTGLGRVSAWTSDASVRWAQEWASWDGYSEFWTTAVKDTFGGLGVPGASLRAVIDGDSLRVELEGEEPWPPGTRVLGQVSGPGLRDVEVELGRSSATSYSGDVVVGQAGVYAVGVVVTNPDGTSTTLSALASHSYPGEYRAGGSDARTLIDVSRRSGGRGEIVPAEVFAAEGLAVGRGRVPLAAIALALAALLWPIDVALRRLNLHGRRVLPPLKVPRLLRRLPRPPRRVGTSQRDPGIAPEAPPDEPVVPPSEPATATTLGRLLEQKRAEDAKRREGR